VTTLHIIGNLVADPELKFIQSGAAVVNFTVADTPRVFDKATNEYKDGETTFWRCSLWREQAESVAESLTKGARVIVVGRTKTRSWEQDGQKRSAIELDVEEIGPSLKYATAKVTRTPKSGGGVSAPPADDPWASSDSDSVPF